VVVYVVLINYSDD